MHAVIIYTLFTPIVDADFDGAARMNERLQAHEEAGLVESIKLCYTNPHFWVLVGSFLLLSSLSL
jgi:hypothetical protein